MAGAQLRVEPNLPTPDQISEEGELSENDDFQSFQTPVDKPRVVNSIVKRQKAKQDVLNTTFWKNLGTKSSEI